MCSARPDTEREEPLPTLTGTCPRCEASSKNDRTLCARCQKAQARANSPACDLPWCDLPARRISGGLCSPHHRRLKENPDAPLVPIKVYVYGEDGTRHFIRHDCRDCGSALEAPENRARARDLCPDCYYVRRRVYSNGYGQCSLPGCERKRVSANSPYCQTNTRQHQAGREMTPLPPSDAFPNAFTWEVVAKQISYRETLGLTGSWYNDDLTARLVTPAQDVNETPKQPGRRQKASAPGDAAVSPGKRRVHRKKADPLPAGWAKVKEPKKPRLSPSTDNLAGVGPVPPIPDAVAGLAREKLELWGYTKQLIPAGDQMCHIFEVLGI